MYSYEPCYCHCLNCIFYFRATGFLIQHSFNCKETFQGIKYHSASIQRRKKSLRGYYREYCYILPCLFPSRKGGGGARRGGKKGPKLQPPNFQRMLPLLSFPRPHMSNFFFHPYPTRFLTMFVLLSTLFKRSFVPCTCRREIESDSY